MGIKHVLYSHFKYPHQQLLQLFHVSDLLSDLSQIHSQVIASDIHWDITPPSNEKV